MCGITWDNTQKVTGWQSGVSFTPACREQLWDHRPSIVLRSTKPLAFWGAMHSLCLSPIRSWSLVQSHACLGHCRWLGVYGKEGFGVTVRRSSLTWLWALLLISRQVWRCLLNPAEPQFPHLSKVWTLITASQGWGQGQVHITSCEKGLVVCKALYKGRLSDNFHCYKTITIWCSHWADFESAECQGVSLYIEPQYVSPHDFLSTGTGTPPLVPRGINVTVQWLFSWTHIFSSFFSVCPWGLGERKWCAKKWWDFVPVFTEVKYLSPFIHLLGNSSSRK